MSMPKIEMYTKMWCPYCARAKKLLASKGVEFEEFDITMGGAKRQEMLTRAPGHTTVPSIFIDGRHIGGSDDLAALEAKGELDGLLAA
jgi:glutaredoxin 3